MTADPAPTLELPIVYTDAELIAALRRCALEDGRLPRNLYARSRCPGEPTAHLVELRHGTWNAALTAAGLTPVPRALERDAAAPKFSRPSMLEALRCCEAETGSWALRVYDAWREGLNDPSSVPSSGAIRARFGKWTSATAQAHHQVSEVESKIQPVIEID